MTARRKLSILVVFDLGFPPPADHDYGAYLSDDAFETERHVTKALKGMGHEVKLFGVFNDIHPLIEELQTHPPDLVFNLCEGFNNDRGQEPNVAGLFELMNVRYTGAGPTALRLCKDKGLTKKILSYHRITIPRFVVSRRRRPLTRLRRFTYPAFIKPLGLEASEGIAQMSFADNEGDCLERVRFIHESLQVDAIVEEYIDGREIYVGILGNHHLHVLPPRELFFEQVPNGEPKFATFKAKWDQAYRKRWGIKSGPCKEIPEALRRRIGAVCRKVYRLFEIKGYARIDLRLNERGDVVFLEANPNPSLSLWEDFALAAKRANIEYDELVRRIVQLAGA
ncbi:MAG TPA: ATP-grasp domain-containing protein [Candidatus Polarisedimenticolia bacterium]|nr:ATP-grasp domain-containing protein [Candidatus Polarisedimenticolia bacterium]